MGDTERRLVDVVDRRQSGWRLVEWHAGGDAAAGEADAVADEQVAVTAGDVVEVERPGRLVGEHGGRAHQRIASSREQLGRRRG